MKRLRPLAALAVVAALGLTACGGGSSSSNSSSGSSGSEKFNSALGAIYKPSTAKGGILKLGQAGDWADSVDPGDTYYGYSWDFLRTYARSLVMFKPAPGKASQQLVGDLATGLGKSSNGDKTWTYTIRKGVKFEDGTEVHAQDVAYAVERSFDKNVLKNGPTYFDDFLAWPKGYKGAYQSKNMDVSSAIETPDNYTIVFHLVKAFAGFDYFAQLPQTAPVPKAKDTGAKYKEHVVSSGPYMWDQYQPGKMYTLKRNPKWDQATDPNRKALPDGYQIMLNMNPDDVDNQVISGDIDVDIQGTGVQPAALSRVLGDPKLKLRADNPTGARLWYTNIMSTVKPLDDVNCRQAIEYAMDKTSYQNAYGGPFAGGDLATTVLPPVVAGYQKFDLYPTPGGKGDVTKAKESLKKCGQPNGFSTSIAYRAERPKEKATAEAFQQALSKVGIKLTIKPFPEGTYSSATCGLPSFVVKNGLGLCVYGWGADWNDGFGDLSQIVDSRTIRAAGGASNQSVRDPQVDTMLDAAVAEPDMTKRNAAYAAIDKKVMADAFIYPGVYSKALLLRPLKATNVFINEAFGYYDYMAMGAK